MRASIYTPPLHPGKTLLTDGDTSPPSLDVASTFLIKTFLRVAATNGSELIQIQK